MHIVDELITERAPHLVAKPRLFKRVRPWLYKLLSYDHAVKMADTVAPMSGRQAFAHMAQLIKPNLSVSGTQHIPASGRCIIMANHPTGLADGMAVFKALSPVRPDHIYLANADALRVMPHAEDIIIPVEWVKEKRTREKTRQTLLATKDALENELSIVIFPSGVLGKLTWSGIKDKPWQSSAVAIAKKYNAPIIPLHIKARNSWLYYLFTWLNAELRDITLFNELLNKKNRKFKMTFGPAINAQTLPQNADDATQMIRDVLEAL